MSDEVNEFLGSSPELFQPVELSTQALNRAMLEAVEFVHAEGWDNRPALFALVPARILMQATGEMFGDDADVSPLSLIIQEAIPEHIRPGSDELGDYLARIAWPEEVAGVILAQEIEFLDSSADDSDDAAGVDTVEKTVSLTSLCCGTRAEVMGETPTDDSTALSERAADWIRQRAV